MKLNDRNAGRLARQTAQTINDRPWVQYAFLLGGGVCAIGAMSLTVCGRPGNQYSHPLVEYTNRLFRKWHGNSIEHYNDQESTTKENVIEILMKFADNYDPQGGRNG